MFVAPLIERKRDGQALQDHEWTSLIRSYVAGTMPDYQMAALVMAQSSYCMFGRAIPVEIGHPITDIRARDERGASAVQETPRSRDSRVAESSFCVPTLDLASSH